MEFSHESQLPGALSLRVFGSPNALAQAIAGRVHEAVMTGVQARSRALLLLDTGPVLRRGYSLLAPAALPWASVQIALSPARSNELATSRAGFLRDTLLHGAAADAQLMLPGFDEAAGDEEADLLMLAMSANGSIAEMGKPATPGRRALETRRIVIVGQGIAARDAFERQASAPPGSGSFLQDLAQHAKQPVEFCWCS